MKRNAIFGSSLFSTVLLALGVGLAVNDIPAQTNCVPLPSNCVNWWRAEGDATDNVGASNGQLVNGAGFAAGQVGQAFSFNRGRFQYVEVPDSPQWGFGTNDFSMELWANLRTWNPSGIYYIPDDVFVANDEGAGVMNKWMFALFNGQLVFHVNSPSLEPQFLIQAPFAPRVNQWYHLAVVRSGNVFTAYTNGVAVGSQNYTVNMPAPNAPLTIGQGEGLGYVNGLIDEVSIYSRALSVAEIQSIYNAGAAGKCFTPPAPTAPAITMQPASQTVTVGSNVTFNVTASGTAPLTYQWSVNATNIDGATNASFGLTDVQLSDAGDYAVVVANAGGSAASSNAVLTVNALASCDPPPSGLISWWRAEGDATDSVGANNGQLVNGAGFAAGQVGQAFSFSSGSNQLHQYVEVPDSPQWGFGTNDFSMELWANLRTWSRSGIYYIPDDVFVACDEGGGVMNKWMFALFNGRLVFHVNSPSLGPQFLIQAPFAPQVNQWYHLAVVRSGNLFTAYVNGVAVGSQNYTVNMPTPNAPLTIGQAEGLGYVNGLMDEVSIYSRALSAAEIQSIYNAGAAGKCFTPPAPTAPAITMQPASQTVTVGSNVTFSVAASGTAPLTYQWSVNATNIDGATNASFGLTDVQLSDAGDYAVVVANAGGSATSSNAVLTVNVPPPPVPPTITMQPLSQTVIVGANVTFSVAAASTAPLTYQWSVNATNIDGATNASFGLTDVQASDAGDYAVVVANAGGSATSSNAVLTVNALASCDPPPAGLISWWRAEGDATDSVGASNGQLVNGAGFGAGEVGQAFSFNIGTSQYVEVPDSPQWGFGTNDFSIELWANLRTWNPSGIYYMPDDAFVACDEGGGVVNKWMFALFNGRLVFHVNSPSLGPQFLIQAPFAPRVNQWYHLAVVRGGSLFTAYINGVAVGSQNYTVDMPAPNAPLTIGQAEGLGYVNGLMDEVSIYSRALSDAEIQGIYNAGAAGKCFTPPAPAAPVITVQPASQTVTVGANVTFNVTATGTAPLTYQWSVNAANIDGATNASLALTNVQYANGGDYAVLVANAAGSATSSNAVLTVNPVPPCDPAPSGLINWWRADGDANDSVSGDDGQMVNGAAFGPGELGQAFSFNSASNQFMQVPASWSLGTNDFSIELWANFQSWSPSGIYYMPDDVLVANDEGQGVMNKWIFALFNGQLVFHVNAPSLGPQFLIQAPFAPQVNQWYHLAVVRSGSLFTAYVNGVAVGSQNYTVDIPTPDAPLTIGQAEGLGYVNGSIDEVSVYCRALSAAEIQGIYNAGGAGKCH